MGYRSPSTQSTALSRATEKPGSHGKEKKKKEKKKNAMVIFLSDLEENIRKITIEFYYAKI